MPAVDTDIFRVWAASIPLVENGLRISFLTYIQAKEAPSVKNLLSKSVLEAHDEYQYLHMIDDIIKTGNVKGDCTGTGTLSKFGIQKRLLVHHRTPSRHEETEGKVLDVPLQAWHYQVNHTL